MTDWDAYARKIDECERLRGRVDALEAAFRRRAERARDERDIATMMRMRDAARAAKVVRAEMAALAEHLSAELAQAQAQQTAERMAALMARLEATAEKSRELAGVYEPFVDWEAEPS